MAFHSGDDFFHFIFNVNKYDYFNVSDSDFHFHDYHDYFNHDYNHFYDHDHYKYVKQYDYQYEYVHVNNDNNDIDKYQYEHYNITMPDNLVDNDSHISDFRGTLKTVSKLPVDGDEIENVQAGDMCFDETKEVLYGYSGTAWYGTKGFTTSTSSSTSTSTSTTTS